MPLEFRMPKLGESVTEGTIGRWLKQPGEQLEQFEPMLEVSTDKVDTEVSSPVDGTLLEILVPEGETVAVGTVIARLGDAQDAGTTTAASGRAQAPQVAGAAAASAVAERISPISPAVARIAAEHHVDLHAIRGTGAGGRISKKDIEAFIAVHTTGSTAGHVAPPAVADRNAHGASAALAAETQQTLPSRLAGKQERAQEQVPAAVTADDLASPAPSSAAALPPITPGPEDELVPLSPMRRAIAEHMLRSKRIAPHVTTVMEADVTRIAAHRAARKDDFERQGVKLTFTPYFVQAVVAGLLAVPIINASLTDDGILLHQRLNIGVAVALPDGLIVPVIKDADDKSLLGLARAVNDLADRARSRRLQPDETQNGTFTITNHGVSGSLFAMPIIHQPQSAILGIGAIQKRAVVIFDGATDAIAIRPMCYLSLTFDHRMIDGATADSFLAAVKRTLEQYAG